MLPPPRSPVEPCPSTLLQQHMADLLRQGPDVAPSFLNSVLNQLNWAFSEFIGMIQEVGCGGMWARVLQRTRHSLQCGQATDHCPPACWWLRSNRLPNVLRGTSWTADSSRYVPPALTSRSACCVSWR